ncbi:ATP-binding protein [candidate division CSSED10-310 bacterium]|uniref:ATP-binding protein n=1 Tax=candidate division CSSED10-310 bacterium TaxID=2855610 RepID=A0ABV6Z4A9_UNCC1
MNTQAELKMSNNLEEIHRLHTFAEEFCTPFSVSPSALNMINLSLEEVVTNVISYGYDDDKEHTIIIKLTMEDQPASQRWLLTIEVWDDGLPFDATAQATPDISKPLDEREIGGLGIHLVRTFMETFEYRRQNMFNVVTMKKNLEKESGTV